ncbi:TetR/AcrR family transcriptional regulator [Agromyces silvae]|uniref:TetR/AcrR family transcriptional regulator n=1 Tax=Agromyces silvae TaxID=3388266 RepID=UPI00280C22E0|nr:TetR/AcrR family transcriptional regulator [Agromyces protaetiae]
MRSDARRNQQRIVDAAREQISSHGPDVPMEQIAAVAGVGVGTLYRHYPTKADLVHAILTEYIESLIAQAEEAAQHLTRPSDAHRAIVALLQDFLETAATNRALKQAAAALNETHATVDQDDRARTALSALVASASADGDLNPGVTADDVLLLMNTAPTHLAPLERRRWLEICIAGISREPTPLSSREAEPPRVQKGSTRPTGSSPTSARSPTS